MSLGFRVRKFCDSGRLYNFYSFFWKKILINIKKEMTLGFRVGKSCNNNLLYFIYNFQKKNKNKK